MESQRAIMAEGRKEQNQANPQDSKEKLDLINLKGDYLLQFSLLTHGLIRGFEGKPPSF